MKASSGKATTRKQYEKILALQSSGRLDNLTLTQPKLTRFWASFLKPVGLNAHFQAVAVCPGKMKTVSQGLGLCVCAQWYSGLWTQGRTVPWGCGSALVSLKHDVTGLSTLSLSHSISQDLHWVNSGGLMPLRSHVQLNIHVQLLEAELSERPESRSPHIPGTHTKGTTLSLRSASGRTSLSPFCHALSPCLAHAPSSHLITSGWIIWWSPCRAASAAGGFQEKSQETPCPAKE